MHRGEIWLAALEPTIGAELKKVRPAIVVSSDEVGVLPLRVVVPLTEWRDEFREAPWMVEIKPSAQNGLRKRSAADTFQIKSVSVQRLRKKLGAISPGDLLRVIRAVGTVIEHP